MGHLVRMSNTLVKFGEVNEQVIVKMIRLMASEVIEICQNMVKELKWNKVIKSEHAVGG